MLSPDSYKVNTNIQNPVTLEEFCRLLFMFVNYITDEPCNIKKELLIKAPDKFKG